MVCITRPVPKTASLLLLSSFQAACEPAQRSPEPAHVQCPGNRKGQSCLSFSKEASRKLIVNPYWGGYPSDSLWLSPEQIQNLVQTLEKAFTLIRQKRYQEVYAFLTNPEQIASFGYQLDHSLQETTGMLWLSKRNLLTLGSDNHTLIFSRPPRSEEDAYRYLQGLWGRSEVANKKLKLPKISFENLSTHGPPDNPYLTIFYQGCALIAAEEVAHVLQYLTTKTDEKGKRVPQYDQAISRTYRRFLDRLESKSMDYLKNKLGFIWNKSNEDEIDLALFFLENGLPLTKHFMSAYPERMRLILTGILDSLMTQKGAERKAYPILNFLKKLGIPRLKPGLLKMLSHYWVWNHDIAKLTGSEQLPYPIQSIKLRHLGKQLQQEGYYRSAHHLEQLAEAFETSHSQSKQG